MESLQIQGNKFIPYIDFDYASGNLNISGQSFHENANEFYEPVLDWLHTYVKIHDGKITLNIKMTYFNTPVSRIFLQMIRALEEFEGKTIINWYYPIDDDDLREDGENIIECTKLTSNLIAY